MHSPAVRNMDNAIAKMEAELKKLKDEREAMVQMPANQRLAIQLHSSTCSGDHTEHCGWFWEIKDGVHDWTRDVHKRRLYCANIIISKMKQLGIEEDLVPALAEIVLANRY